MKPVLTVDSGDVVTLHSFPAGGEACLPRQAGLIPADYRHALDTMVQGPGPHFITGPVFVRGAKAGDTLQVDILAAKPRMEWGFVSIIEHSG